MCIPVPKFNIKSDNNIQINNHLKSLSSKYKTNIDGMKKIFKNNNLDFELYVNEIETEFNWQKLIFSTFRDKITLDKNEIDNELNDLLETKSNLQEYELSEIEINEKLKNKDYHKSWASIIKIHLLAMVEYLKDNNHGLYVGILFVIISVIIYLFNITRK